MQAEPRGIGRRGLAAGLAAVLAVPRAAGAALPVPPGDRLAFHILRGDSEIGSHTMIFTQRGQNLVVTSDVKIVIYLGPIAVFRYVHHVIETWDGGRFIAAEATTNDDGTAHFMRARQSAEGMMIDGSISGRYVAPPGALLATHWNRAELNGPMINPQGGKLLEPVVTPEPEAPIPLADGRRIPARRYSLTGDTKLDLWYDRADVWSATRFVAQDGSVVLYRRG